MESIQQRTRAYPLKCIQGCNLIFFGGQNDGNLLFYLTTKKVFAFSKGFRKFLGGQLAGCSPGCGSKYAKHISERLKIKQIG